MTALNTPRFAFSSKYRRHITLSNQDPTQTFEAACGTRTACCCEADRIVKLSSIISALKMNRKTDRDLWFSAAKRAGSLIMIEKATNVG